MSNLTQQDLNEFWKKLVEKAQYMGAEEIMYFTHCTKLTTRRKMEKTGKLLGRYTGLPSRAPLAKNEHLKGIWFEMHTRKLPKKSPYGNRRLTIQAHSFMQYLFSNFDEDDESNDEDDQGEDDDLCADEDEDNVSAADDDSEGIKTQVDDDDVDGKSDDGEDDNYEFDSADTDHNERINRDVDDGTIGVKSGDNAEVDDSVEVESEDDVVYADAGHTDKDNIGGDDSESDDIEGDSDDDGDDEGIIEGSDDDDDRFKDKETNGDLANKTETTGNGTSINFSVKTSTDHVYENNNSSPRKEQYSQVSVIDKYQENMNKQGDGKEYRNCNDLIIVANDETNEGNGDNFVLNKYNDSDKDTDDDPVTCSAYKKNERDDEHAYDRNNGIEHRNEPMHMVKEKQKNNCKGTKKKRKKSFQNNKNLPLWQRYRREDFLKDDLPKRKSEMNTRILREPGKQKRIPFLFFECAHVYNIQYMRLVLIDQSDGQFEWCQENLKCVNIKCNPFFEYHSDTGKIFSKSRSEYGRKLIYIDVLVVGNLYPSKFTVSPHWDQVKKLNRAGRDPMMGILKKK